MGINHATIKLLMREGNRERFSGRLLTIGAQNIISTTSHDLQRLAQKMNFKLKLAVKSFFLDKKHNITDTDLFLSIGFDSLDSVDYSDFEQCTIKHDLNTNVPADLYDKYDLIFDGGTTEHIYNLPKVLENYNKMLRVGGRIIHALPSNNYVDHGFYMFSPTLFWDYYSANNWEIKDSLFIRYPNEPDKGFWDIYNYSPHCLDKVSFGSLSKGRCAIFFVVRKKDKSTFNASVQQGFYLEAWSGKLNAENIRFEKNNLWKKKILAILPRGLKSILRPLYWYIYSKIPMNFLLKRVDRY